MSEPDANRDPEDGVDIWRRIAGTAPRVEGVSGPHPGLVMALADRVTAATVAAVLPDAGLPQATVRQSQLLNRFRHVAGRRWYAAIVDAGFPALAMKGLASGAWLYAAPQDRGVSDADLLVRRQDLGSVIDLLGGQGFAFAEQPTRSRWGFVSEASFQPLLSPDGAVNIDLHVAGDAAPFDAALPTADMLATAQVRDGLTIPSPTHAFMLSASHAARDLFTADAAKTVIDGLLMFQQADRIDWSEVGSRARKGRMLRPVAVFVALLGRLGADVSQAAGELPVDRVGGRFFERIVRDHCTMFPPSGVPGTGERLARQWLLGAAPSVALRRDARRIAGLIRPHSGLPGR
ncbi:MAG: nucleotidyltransferase family protein [Minwuia sp.]|nr:nucleotidyltransferase family protein [Minwuia sp.]